MSDIAKSLTNALEDLNAQAEGKFDSDPEPEKNDSELNFDLNKAEDLEEIDGEAINVDPFLKGIAATIDQNNGRVSRAVEGALNIMKAQNEAIVALSSQVAELNDVINKIATAPAQKNAALTKSEAENLKSNVLGREFNEPSETPGTSISPAGDSQQNTGLVKATIAGVLRKAYDSGDKSVGNDILRLDNVPAGFDKDTMLSILSPASRKVVEDSLNSGNDN